MIVDEEGAPVVVVRRRMAVPRERVFAAWLDSESLAEFMRPANFGRSTVSVDPRVGGAFKIMMQGPTQAIEHHGEYLMIDPPSLLSFTWISKNTDDLPTVVTIEFHERGTGTELVLTHRRLPARAVEGHRRGWTDIVGLLEEVLVRGQGGK
jgi:uncharacterized protein YndB with AHSA1/START domain